MHGGIEFKFLSSTAVWLYNLIEKVTPGIHSGDEFGDDTSIWVPYKSNLHIAADKLNPENVQDCSGLKLRLTMLCPW